VKITETKFISMLCLLIIAWAFHYYDALIGMEDIWRRSDTFAHGYFILPISLWLLWRDRETLFANTTEQSWFALLILVGSLFVGLIAYAADINVLRQLSAIISLIAILWLMLGNKLALYYKFPLFFLIFMVPMGENLIPWLQGVTAWFTVFFLGLNGIPVFVDGLYIQTPTGMFEVAVACSGIRYLIASVAVGTLYAYLTYQKTSKQIIFIIFASVLPILANGMRAYGIVAIAHYSDMKYATGVDHLIYGWLFFGFVIMFMFWVGGKFADPIKATKTKLSSNKAHQHSYFYLASLIFFFVTSILLYSIPVIEKTTRPIASLKLSPSDSNVTKSRWGITFNDGLKRSHLLKKTGVEVFKAVYGNKQTSGEMINHKNRLHDQSIWTVVERRTINIDGGVAELVHLRNISGTSRSYLYQYNAGSYQLISPNTVKVVQALQSLFRLSDYSEVLAVSIEGNTDLIVSENKLIANFTEMKAKL